MSHSGPSILCRTTSSTINSDDPLLNMSGEKQTWERYAVSSSGVGPWPHDVEDIHEELFALVDAHPMGDGPLTIRLVSSDNDLLQTTTKNIAMRLAETAGRDTAALVDVNLTDLDIGSAHGSEEERDNILQRQVEDKLQQLGDAMLASHAGPTVLSLQQVDAIPGKWQSSFFSVLDEHFCNVPNGPDKIEGDPDNLIVISTMKSGTPRNALDLKFKRLMGSTYFLDEER